MKKSRSKTESELKAQRTSGKILATVLDRTFAAAEPGITTLELDALATKELKALGGKPVFKGYQGAPGAIAFPGVICISVNDEIIHGIPGPRVLEAGDILSLDFGVRYDGMITDSARTAIIGDAGEADPQARRLVDMTEQAMLAGIAAAREGNRVNDISRAIERVLTKERFGIVREFVGHGVGHELHEEPNVPNYDYGNSGPLLRPGMTLAIEPMASLGGDHIRILNDGWTVVTADGSLAAHWEHTILITHDTPEILTLS